jgi:hypothetical protein
MLSFATSINEYVEKRELMPESRATAQPVPPSQLKLWHTCKPEELSCADIVPVRKALVDTRLPSEPDWKRAVLGDAAVAIGIADRQLKLHRITDPEVDLALSAVLACALDGNPTCAAVISSALRRRSKKFRSCFQLSLLWRHQFF